RLQDPHRVAVVALCACGLALRERDATGVVERARELDGVARVRVERPGLGEDRLRLLELAAPQVQEAARAERARPRSDARALLGERERLLDQFVRAVELEPLLVRVGEEDGGLALVVLASDRARDRQRLL